MVENHWRVVSVCIIISYYYCINWCVLATSLIEESLFQFEHFHVVSDPSNSSLHQTSFPPPVYSNLQMLAESGFPQSTTSLQYGLPHQRGESFEIILPKLEDG